MTASLELAVETRQFPFNLATVCVCFHRFWPQFTSLSTPWSLACSMSRERERRSVARSREAEKRYNVAIGRCASVYGVASTSRLLDVSKPKTRYWRGRVLNPLWRAGSCGGVRRVFAPEVEEIVCRTLGNLVKACPVLSAQRYVELIREQTGYDVSRTYIKDVLATADWTYVPFFFVRPSHMRISASQQYFGLASRLHTM
jgi:hypothetical protein